MTILIIIQHNTTTIQNVKEKTIKHNIANTSNTLINITFIKLIGIENSNELTITLKEYSIKADTTILLIIKKNLLII